MVEPVAGLLMPSRNIFEPMPATEAEASKVRLHLQAACYSLVLAAGLIALGLIYCRNLERRYIHELAPEFTDEKLQGAALQKEAFRQSDLLVLYGSSELAKEMPNNAVQFFADYPTGFRVFPVGKAGASALNILQKIAAVGREARGRKFAYSISPGWYFSEAIDRTYYEGNFSEMQAVELVFSDELSHDLKRAIARRLDDYPATIDDDWFLDFAVRRFAKDSLLDRAALAAISPLGKLRSAAGRMQDHFSAALHIMDEDEKLNPDRKRGAQPLNWNDILKRAAQFANATAVRAKKSEVAMRRKTQQTERTLRVRRGLAGSEEWTDLDLLMRTSQELGAQPLFLSMPFEDIRLEVYDLDNSARLGYISRMQALTRQFEFPLVLFREHEDDPAFTVDFLDHLSGEGWLYFNKALDDFFHDRISSL